MWVFHSFGSTPHLSLFGCKISRRDSTANICGILAYTHPAALSVDPDSQVAIDKFSKRSDDNRNQVRVAIDDDFPSNRRRHGEQRHDAKPRDHRRLATEYWVTDTHQRFTYRHLPNDIIHFYALVP